MLQGGNRPAPIKPATFLRGLPYRTVKLGISLLHRQRAISWYAFGVACSPVEFQGCRVGLKFDALLRLDAVLCDVSKQTIKLSCLCCQVSMKSNCSRNVVKGCIRETNGIAK